MLSLPVIVADSACNSPGSYSTSTNTSTSTLDSIVIRHIFENNRRYHGFRAGRYLQPNDKAEQEHLDLQHHCLKLLFSAPYTAPLSTISPKRILDLGTGTGRWAIELAYEFPGARVTGIDLSPIQPSWIPENCDFEIDDLESPWTHVPASVDYIHARFLAAAIDDWPRLLEQCFVALKPGGYVELTDLAGTTPTGEVAQEYAVLMEKGYEALGREVAPGWGELLTSTGFVGVTESVGRLPVGNWPILPRLKELGVLWRECMLTGLEGGCLAMLTRYYGWTREEVEVLVGNLRREVVARGQHRVTMVVSVVARKPGK